MPACASPSSSAQLRDLAAQRIEGAGELLRHRAKRLERCLQFGALVVDQLEIGGCHAGEESNFCASAAIYSADQPVTDTNRVCGGAGVNNLSGAQTVFAQLLDQRRTADLQQTRGLGDRAVGFLERFANQADFDGGQMILQIDAAARHCI